MITLIWCEDKNGGIGLNNSIPWHIKEDLEFFKATTLNHTIVMGRKTFESIGKPLKNRKNIIITKNKEYKINDQSVEIYNNIQDVLRKYKNEDIFVIGGKQIYFLFNKYADRLLVSKLFESYNCDTYMNDFDYSNFYLKKVDNKSEFKIYHYFKK
ncbi:dihydrofolate reductase [Malacoplasma iowae]|uniref:dihydrofolate reductase n=2 Tax=Malacoplasma iowae TaxID=2116 RepID=A0A084U4F8_MALIO|nr:dihydrofolate reductase [Malacoplasma iowae]VEU62838.1 Dihydrofolate reductase [Mycoplasmopsis fermentans]EGZ30799.1 dihydrofolate reductase [Malacoplasma iowae 695]KFB07844.1 dihydrofolate reductase [Malacoplasma iowae DK-CPA]QHG89411.1 dihydrofolate reductase [Malacoplasma iowae 695]WPL35870.1 dihydrofolate reductase [Malacoplasma iowae]